MKDIKQYITNVNECIEKHYNKVVTVDHHMLKESLPYALFGGKSLRASLVFLIGNAYNTKDEDLFAPALAVELIHAYSLVHDDLPSMDNDELRRGKPSTHVAYGEPQAILIGDALLTLALNILSTAPNNSDSKVMMISMLTEAAGVNGMITGQVMDIDAENKQVDFETLCNIHSNKTGALISASILLGAFATKAPSKLEIVSLRDFGHHLGLAFQIQDDLLDVTQDTEQLGKPSNSDVKSNKATFPSIVGKEKSRELIDLHISKAFSSLNNLDIDTSTIKLFVNHLTNRTY